MLNHLAEKLYGNLRNGHGISVDGKVLDVGCRDGRYFEILKRLGAEEVHGVDPELQPEAKTNPNVDPRNHYECGIEGLPDDVKGTFDYLAIFKLFLGGADYDNRVRMAKSLVDALKPEGNILVTFTSEDELRVWEPVLDHYFDGFSEQMVDWKQTRTAREIEARAGSSASFRSPDRYKTEEHIYRGRVKGNAAELPDPDPESLKVKFIPGDTGVSKEYSLPEIPLQKFDLGPLRIKYYLTLFGKPTDTNSQE
jgi:SAM-dependent methyltransferase